MSKRYYTNSEIIDALKRHKWDRGNAANELGCDVVTVYKRIIKLKAKGTFIPNAKNTVHRPGVKEYDENGEYVFKDEDFRIFPTNEERLRYLDGHTTYRGV